MARVPLAVFVGVLVTIFGSVLTIVNELFRFGGLQELFTPVAVLLLVAFVCGGVVAIAHRVLVE